jgi:ATP-binding cassette subfamily C (CFTR/MRP) protein 1
MSSELEAQMVSVERIEQYKNINSEAERVKDADSETKRRGWVNEGEIIFEGVEMRYRNGLPLVLKGLTLCIPGGSKVGVVGRTGAGKSTLLIALLRIVEVESGEIIIDGVNTKDLGLEILRSSIAVIPQDPVLFSGNIRKNLDPFGKHSDSKVLEVIGKVGLSDRNGGSGRVSSLFEEVTEGGGNYSVGERQLIVIARALLERANIVVMDEATASVDIRSEQAIEKVMKRLFLSLFLSLSSHLSLSLSFSLSFALFLTQKHYLSFSLLFYLPSFLPPFLPLSLPLSLPS